MQDLGYVSTFNVSPVSCASVNNIKIAISKYFGGKNVKPLRYDVGPLFGDLECNFHLALSVHFLLLSVHF